MRRIVIAVVTVAIGAGIGGWFVLSNTPEHADASAPTEAVRRPPSVTVARVETREIAEEVHVSGSLVAREEVMVAPEIEGLAVTEILVEEGDHVEQGQVLARLSRSAIDAEAAQASAAIAQSKASIAEAEATVLETQQALERSETLRKSGTVSAQHYDQALSAAQVADARLNAANENLKVAEAQTRSDRGPPRPDRDQGSVRRHREAPQPPSRRHRQHGGGTSVPSDRGRRDRTRSRGVDVTLARLQAGNRSCASLPRARTSADPGPDPPDLARDRRHDPPRPCAGRTTGKRPCRRSAAFASGVVEIGRQSRSPSRPRRSPSCPAKTPFRSLPTARCRAVRSNSAFVHRRGSK